MNARMLANKVGEFMNVASNNSMGIDKSLRVKIKIDVRKALTHEIKLKMRGGREQKIRVKYEKLPLFCFHCGKLGHGTKDCESYKGEGTPEKKLGNWLKASPWRPGFKVSGHEDENEDRSCARRLFITKPKREEKSLKQAEITEVVDLLSTVELQDKLTTQLVESPVIAEKQMEKLVETSIPSEPQQEEEVDREEENQTDDQRPENNTVNTPEEEDFGKKGRKWKRLAREYQATHSNSHSELNQKRGSSSIREEGCVDMEIEYMEILKKRGVIVQTLEDPVSVAGPTHRALHHQ